jgi:hypothetical protein
MTYTVTNPGENAVIMQAFEGQDYYIEPGGSLEVESERAALTLVDYGARLSSQERAAAIDTEGNRTPEEREAIVRAREGREKGVTTSEDLSGRSLTDKVDPLSLKGKALDEALTNAGLAKSGSVDEKRARLFEHLNPVEPVVVDDEHGGPVEKPVDPDGVAEDGEPATPGGTIVEGVTAAGNVAPFDDQNAPVVVEDAAEGTEVDNR